MSYAVLLLLILFTAAVAVVTLVNLAMSKQYLLLTPRFRYPVRDEGVEFTVYRPEVVEAARPYKIIVFAYVGPRAGGVDEAATGAQIETRVEEALAGAGAGYQPLGGDAKKSLPRDGLVTFKLTFEGLKFEGSTSYSFSWTGEFHQKDFTFTAPPELEGKTVYGNLRVLAGVVLVAEIGMSILVDTAAARHAAGSPPLAQSAPPYRNIFVSYSREDSAIVRRVAGYARSTGDKFLIDVDELRSGQEWWPTLQDKIKQADIFQLFWSTNAMRSPEVKREWEYALSLGKPDFVRASYWEEPLPRDETLGLPPLAIDKTHFYRIPLEPDPINRAVVAFGVGHSLGVAVLMMSIISNVISIDNRGVSVDRQFGPRPTPTAVPTPGLTPLPSPTATPVIQGTPTPSPETTPEATPTPEVTPVPTPVPTPDLRPTPQPSPTAATPTPEATPVPTPVPTPDVRPTPQPSPTPNSADGQANLAWSVNVEPSTDGRSFLYRINCRNKGEAAAREVMVTQTYPTYLRVVDVRHETAGRIVQEDGSVTLIVPRLEPGASIELAILFRVPSILNTLPRLPLPTLKHRAKDSFNPLSKSEAPTGHVSAAPGVTLIQSDLIHT